MTTPLHHLQYCDGRPSSPPFTRVLPWRHGLLETQRLMDAAAGWRTTSMLKFAESCRKLALSSVCRPPPGGKRARERILGWLVA